MDTPAEDDPTKKSDVFVRPMASITIFVDHDAVLEAERLTADREINVEAFGVVRVEVWEKLAEVALEKERRDVGVEPLDPSCGGGSKR